MTATTIKERPILFSGPMVRAILAGRKSQTRRIIKPQHVEGLETDDDGRFSFMHSPTCGGYCDYACAAAGEILDGHIGWTPWGSSPTNQGNLWVRETWGPRIEDGKPHPVQQYVKYKADFADDLPPDNDDDWHEYEAKWRPSIHMPRWASRLTLEVTGVRVERLQAISEADAAAEGVPFNLKASTHKFGFENLWNSINGCNAYEANPWVWVVSFKRTGTTP